MLIEKANTHVSRRCWTISQTTVTMTWVVFPCYCRFRLTFSSARGCGQICYVMMAAQDTRSSPQQAPCCPGMRTSSPPRMTSISSRHAMGASYIPRLCDYGCQIGGRVGWGRWVWGFLGSSHSDICCHHSVTPPLCHLTVYLLFALFLSQRWLFVESSSALLNNSKSQQGQTVD